MILNQEDPTQNQNNNYYVKLDTTYTVSAVTYIPRTKRMVRLQVMVILQNVMYIYPLTMEKPGQKQEKAENGPTQTVM